MFKLIGFYSNDLQSRYIITIFSELNQVFNTLELVCLDQNSNFIAHFGISLYPTFLLLKNDKFVDKLVGKVSVTDVIQWLHKQPAVV